MKYNILLYEISYTLYENVYKKRKIIHKVQIKIIHKK